MKLGTEILKVLNKVYESSKLIKMPFKRYDMAFRTDAQGRPVLLFLGKRNEQGIIKGERFARNIVEANDGTILKDYWENKGKAA